ncbi:MAG: hypothetical protein FWE64_03295 [Alphaproteobacteria bacterium]|nr:hypothetical protein [Alphaproteobacteria bacterium]
MAFAAGDKSKMNSRNASSLENFFISLAGHLAIIAMLLTSVAIFGDPLIRIVAPDAIQITEIDLSRVEITRDETHLRNVAAPPPPPEPRPTPRPPAPDPGETESVAAHVAPPPPPAERPRPAPPQRTTITVNRETTSLNRTMTVSVVDALRVAMTRCWQFDASRPGVAEIRAVAHLEMNPNGMVRTLRFETESRADDDPAFAYIIETIRTAIGVCQPFRMLPASEFESWRRIRLTFYPATGAVQ